MGKHKLASERRRNGVIPYPYDYLTSVVGVIVGVWLVCWLIRAATE